jgi:aspartate carbamoyltransferase regulatory subunit
MSEKKEFYIKPIPKGTTIDHLPVGTALRILQVISIEDNPITVAIGVESRKLGRKDLVFIENKYLSKAELEKIALIAPNATINFIKDGKVDKKFNLSIPEKAIGMISCINPKCITNAESIETKFSILRNPLRAKCYYCETIMSEREFRERVK